MKVPILDTKRQAENLKEEILPKVEEVILSGGYIQGPKVLELEANLCDYLGVKHAITVGNGTDALVIALKACGIKDGDEVITTPFTFFATGEAIALVGAIPVFVDVEEDTFNIDSSKIEEKITNKTKAILPVHIFGQAANMDEIVRIAKAHNLFVIEDACQAIGCSYKDKKIGSIGDIACFSFYPTKNLGAFGDGGLITTNNDELDTICRAIREHAGGQIGLKAKELLRNNKAGFDKIEEINALYNPYKYYNYLIGQNSRLDAIQAVVLNVKLKYLKQYNLNRRKIASVYSEKLKNVGDIIVPSFTDEESHIWHQYVIKTNKKDDLIKFLAESEITAGAFYPVPLHLQDAFLYLNYKKGDFLISENLSKQTVCLPIFPELTMEEVDYVVDKIKEFYEIRE